MLDSRLLSVLSPHGSVVWRFDSCIAARVLGPERARALWAFFAGGQYERTKFLMYVLVLIWWIVMAALRIFHPAQLNLEWLEVSWIVSSVYALALLVATSCFFFDLRVVRIVIVSFNFMGNVGVGAIAVWGVSDQWGFDSRLVLSIVLLFLLGFVSCIDAFPPQLRAFLSLPLLSALEAAVFTVLVGLSLQRFPDQHDHEFSMGTLNGLATRNVTISVVQASSDTMIAILALIARLLLNAWIERRRGGLMFVSGPVGCVDDPDGLLIKWLVPRRILFCIDVPADVSIPAAVAASLTPPVIPVLDPRLARVLNADRVVEWRFRRTLAVGLFGENNARRIMEIGLGGGARLGPFKFTAWLAVLIAWLTVSGYALFGHRDIRLGVYVLTPFASFAMIGIAAFTIDMGIMAIVLRTSSFWLHVVLATVGSLAVSALWNWDWRCILTTAVVLLIFFISSYDAFVPQLRIALGAHVLFFLCLFYLLVIGSLHLGRFPGAEDDHVIVDLGTFSGLAAAPVIVSVTQIVNDIAIGELVLVANRLYHNVANPRHLTSVRLTLLAEDDPDFTHLAFINSVSFLGIGASFAAKRRVSQLDPVMLESSMGDTSDNPAFYRDPISLPADVKV